MNVYIIGKDDGIYRVYSTLEKAKDCLSRIYGVDLCSGIEHNSHGLSWTFENGWWISEEEVL